MKMLRVLNPVLFCSLLLQTITGLAMFFELELPPGPVIHKYNALFFILAAAIHITLNRPWIRANYFFRRRE